MNGYSKSRDFFNWAFENPEKVKPNHIALYFFIIELSNRLGWKEKFGLPTNATKEAIGMRSYTTYTKTLYDLVEFGFIILIEKSKNQFSSNVIALSKFDKANSKALDKALIMHSNKQKESTRESNISIDKQETINEKPLNNKTNKQVDAEEKSSAYVSCMKIYNDFIFKETRVVAKINARAGKSLNKIIDYIKVNFKFKNPGAEISDDDIISSFNFLFENYSRWDEFYQGQKELHQIESNLVNIISAIYKPKQKKENATINKFLNE